MRKIKFRGKRRDNDEWIEDTSILVDDEICDRVGIMDTTEGLFVDVYPHTVGQYTGYKDYNGIDIYEGDILFRKDLPQGIAFREVIFQHGSLYLRNRIATVPIRNLNIKAWEVVGNIYDNPELLKLVNKEL